MKQKVHNSSEDRLAAGWIERMANGESQALSALYRLYHRPILSIILGIVGDRQVAEEVLQDTFVRAFQRASSFNPTLGVAFAWLVTIGRRLAIDRIRRERSLGKVGNLEQSSTILVEKEGESGEEIKQHLEINWLMDSMQGLSGSQRKIIDMAFFQGFTHYEIADKLGLPIGTVKSHMYRGLDALRKQISGNND